MDCHIEFMEWAVARGVTINGIRPYRFPGRGIGVIAEKKLQTGATLVAVPNSAFRTILTVPKSISEPIGAISVIGILAAELAMDTSEVHAPWQAVLPTKEEFEESVPFMWHASLQSLLPAAALFQLEKQKRMVSLDWTATSTAFPTLSYDVYLYNWFIVNTRTFFFTSPKIKTKKPLVRDDCLALIPFCDHFNHADVGCEVTFSPSGYKICTHRQFEEGEEIYISYGNHSNDFLLAEYGFILDENKWDQISLDQIMLPLFSDEQKQILEEEGYLGKFVLDRDTICYRTQVALRLLCMPTNTWQRLVANGLGDADKYQGAVDKIALTVLNTGLDDVTEKLKQVKLLTSGLPSQRATLGRRWKQISLLLSSEIGRIES